jgi:hypothetical protein
LDRKREPAEWDSFCLELLCNRPVSLSIGRAVSKTKG